MKFLLIRFSSFGDVTQSLSIPSLVKQHQPHCEIHWVVRKDLSELLQNHPYINRVWTFDRGLGFRGLCEIILLLRREKFSHIYDAHRSLRSFLIVLGLSFFRKVRVLRRPRFGLKRWLLFHFRINQFQQPFSGQRDLLKPLEKWGMPFKLPAVPQIFIPPKKIAGIYSEFIALAPSAAHALKRWPQSYFEKLIQLMPEKKFVLLGGPEDLFLQDIVKTAPDRVMNMAGKLSLQDSACAVFASQLLVTNDTGLLHVAEQKGHPAIALMGPAPFGFPSRPSTCILQRDLACRPCSKHGQKPCTNPIHQQCLRDISPEEVLAAINKILVNKSC